MANGQTPAFDVFTVQERGKGKDDWWTKIGGAWNNKDGGGISIDLQALPLTGRLVLLPYKPPNGDEKK